MTKERVREIYVQETGGIIPAGAWRKGEEVEVAKVWLQLPLFATMLDALALIFWNKVTIHTEKT